MSERTVTFSTRATVLVRYDVDKAEVVLVSILPDPRRPDVYDTAGDVTEGEIADAQTDVDENTWEPLEADLPPGVAWEG